VITNIFRTYDRILMMHMISGTRHMHTKVYGRHKRAFKYMCFTCAYPYSTCYVREYDPLLAVQVCECVAAAGLGRRTARLARWVRVTCVVQVHDQQRQYEHRHRTPQLHLLSSATTIISHTQDVGDNSQV